MRKEKSISILYLLMFALIQFPLRFNHYSYLTFAYVYLLPMLYLLFHLDWLYSFFRRMCAAKGGICLILFGFMLLTSCIWPICTGSFEFSFVTEYWRRFFLLLIKNVFLIAFYELNVSSRQKCIEEYFCYYIYSMLLYIAFSAFLLMNGSVRTLLLKYVYLTEKNVVDLHDPTYVTRFGWAGWSGFDATMLCTVGVLMACSLIIRYRNHMTQQVKYLALSCLLLVGNMFYGRTGLTVSALCLIVVVLWAIVRRQTKLVVCIFGIGLLGIAALFVLQSQIQSIQKWFNWAFSAILNFIHTGKFQDNTGSVEVLLERMYWMPEWKTFLLGDGFYNGSDGLYYMHTDSGIMRLMLFFGIINYCIGLMGAVVVYAALCGRMHQLKKLRRGDRVFVFLLLMLVTMLFEIKGESFYKIVCILLPVVFFREPQNDLPEQTGSGKREPK